METLKNLMTLIDANCEKIPEGDYLAMCEAMKGLHGSVRTDDVFTLRSMDYYDMEEELTHVTLELERLISERDNMHYRTKLTKAMKGEAIREYAFTEGLHSLREYTPDALEEAGIRVNISEVYAKYLEDFNHDILQKKKALQVNIQDIRERRDVIVKEMADVI
jgi:3-isopropylmalate dehydratase small subunit